MSLMSKNGKSLRDTNMNWKNLKSTIWIDIGCVVFYSIAIKTIFLWHRYLMYTEGLKKDGSSFSIKSLPFFALLCFSCLTITIILFFRLIFYLKKRRILVNIMCVVLVFVSFLVIGGNFVIEKPPYIYFTQGFSERIKKGTDTSEIRKWANGVKSEAMEVEAIDEIAWPMSVKKLSPNTVWIEMSNTNDRVVKLEWGGPMGHWGLAVGPSEMSIPPSDFKRFGKYIIPVENGCYVWHEVR